MDAIPIRNTCPSPEPPLSQCSRRPGVNDFKFRATQRNYMDDASVGQNGCVGIIKQTDWPAWRIRGQALKRHEFPEIEAEDAEAFTIRARACNSPASATAGRRKFSLNSMLVILRSGGRLR